ncbi:hypothetical protein NDU88_002754 [Pleurodeles waltl]|uniref:Uncharacterized protein n=1 Tax=Pleurodeles waltl TaxID=8319 RepID=A0AAV7W078_PLEWA|nr:hypothetical protein NDU88_002754 [Pleurodeles waltl]
MVRRRRPWNGLMSRGTARSSPHRTPRSPGLQQGDTPRRQGMLHEGPAEELGRRKRDTPEKVQINGGGGSGRTFEAMPGNKLNKKSASKPARQLLFSEALQPKRLAFATTSPQTSSPPTESTTMADKSHLTTMDRILQEITTVRRRIEGMDASITSLTLETKSMRAEIASFQSRVTGLEQRMGLVEAQTTMSRDRDQDLLYLRSKLTDMEDRSRRDDIRLHGIPENEEGADMQSFLSSALPKLTSLDFDPPIEFQRAHRVGPKRSGNPS